MWPYVHRELHNAAYYAQLLVYAENDTDREVIDELIDRARAIGALPGLCWALIVRSQLELREGHLTAAYEAASKAFTVSCLLSLCYGERLRRAGRRVVARVQLRSALLTFEQLGAQPGAEHARRELAASGATLHRHDDADRDQLTPHELQIAVRVAEGKTNRRVAAALFISPKTVEAHLAHIYASSASTPATS